MALIKCRECGREISSKSVACPGCGAPVKAKSNVAGGCLAVIGILVLIGILSSVSQKSSLTSTGSSPRASVTPAPEKMGDTVAVKSSKSSTTPIGSPTPTDSPAVADAKKDALPLAKEAFDSRDDYRRVVLSYWDANEKRLRKKYGDDDRLEDYSEALDNAAKQEFNRLLEAAIGPKPTEGGDYDDNVSSRVYWNVYAHVENTLKEELNDPQSYQGGEPPKFMLTLYRKDWAWGATLDYRAKDAFGAFIKDSINIYVAKNSVIGVAEGKPNITEQELQRALEQNLSEKKKTKRPGKAKPADERADRGLVGEWDEDDLNLTNDPAETEAQFLSEMTDTLAKSKKLHEVMAKENRGPDTPAKNAQLLVDRGKELEKEGEVADIQYWRAANVWLKMRFSPKKVAELMPVFADTLVGSDHTEWTDFGLPNLIGDAIMGKEEALESLHLGALKKIRSNDERFFQVKQALEKRYKGANRKAKSDGEVAKP